MTIRVHGANGAERLGYFQGDNALVRVAIATDAEVEVEVTNVLHTAADLLVLFMDSGIDTSTFTNIPEEYRTVVDGSGTAVVYATAADWDAAYYKQLNYRIIIDAIQQRSVIIAVNSGSNGITVLIERAAVWDSAFPNQYGQLDSAVVEGQILVDEMAALAAAGVFFKTTGANVGDNSTTATTDTAFSKELPLI